MESGRTLRAWIARDARTGSLYVFHPDKPTYNNYYGIWEDVTQCFEIDAAMYPELGKGECMEVDIEIRPKH